MAKDPRIFADVAELLEDYELELREASICPGGGDMSARLQRVSDIRRRYEAEFEPASTRREK